ncbi:4Fe-4S binding protein [Desulfopila sp. IMCC35008]|uniref:4Fe-4S binding protein n=1 Tax=Desulfopila sp. IMCC35008 TaxID=2653858 RepID=UPI0013D093B6|nr:4Fe-4S binding protein [Desulfopila sp. IMCC35008]
MTRYQVLQIFRRLSQLGFLCCFLFLFLKTDYSGSDTLDYAVNILFRIDPFLALVTALAAKTFLLLMLPSLVVLVGTFFLGRSFCGWVCPLGTLLDGVDRIWSTPGRSGTTLYPKLPHFLLLFFLSLAFFGFHIGGYLDPFSILVRGLVLALYPAFNAVTEAFFGFTYSSAPPVVNAVTEPVYGLLQQTVLPADQKFFELGWLSLLILTVVLGLEKVQKRFFCRNICPVGALLAQMSRYGLMKLSGGDATCGKCRICSSQCRMGAIDKERVVDMGSCNLCMQCAVICPKERIGFSPGLGKNRVSSSHGLTRRQLLTIGAASIVLPGVRRSHVLAAVENPLLIRPPGALPEEDFLGRCIRCGECMQVCIGNALQPVLLEGGLHGIFSPKVVSRTGYCEYNCTLCGQVCPTGALQILTRQQKQQWKIGNAWIDRSICLPYSDGIPCMVCEEHCPTGEKAIRFHHRRVLNRDGREVEVKQPYVVNELCIGCGICENKCPLPGRAAIYLTSGGERRNPSKKLPEPEKDSYGYG